MADVMLATVESLPQELICNIDQLPESIEFATLCLVAATL